MAGAEPLAVMLILRGTFSYESERAYVLVMLDFVELRSLVSKKACSSTGDVIALGRHHAVSCNMQ